MCMRVPSKKTEKQLFTNQIKYVNARKGLKTPKLPVSTP